MKELALDHVAERISDSASVEWLHAISETWQQADVPEAKSELVHAIYERIVVAGRRIVSARLTPSAYEHGLALTMPDKAAMARPPVVSDWDRHAQLNGGVPAEVARGTPRMRPWRAPRPIRWWSVRGVRSTRTTGSG